MKTEKTTGILRPAFFFCNHQMYSLEPRFIIVSLSSTCPVGIFLGAYLENNPVLAIIKSLNSAKESAFLEM